MADSLLGLQYLDATSTVTSGPLFCSCVPAPVLPCIVFENNRVWYQYDQNLPEESPLREDLEQACVDTVFGARGVQLLNDRGLRAMKEAGVPIVPAHAIVEEQHWATGVSQFSRVVTDGDNA